VRYMLAAGLLVVAGPVHGQTVGATPAPAIAEWTVARAQAPPPTADEEAQSQRRYQIRVLESILVNSVQHAAETMVSRIQRVTPAMVGPMTDVARARGFVLPDYGVFFDVEVPGLPLSLVWSMRAMERSLDVGSSLDLMRRAVASIADPSARRDAEQALQRIELEVGLPARAAPAGRDRAVEATAVLPGEPRPQPASPADRMGDPNAAYTEVVQAALVDAMLDYSGRIGIGSEEWLTIAARDSHGPSYPGEPYDAVTVVLRLKGSDLADFRADRITREEARKRVEVREF
jgi:hypothetical protein